MISILGLDGLAPSLKLIEYSKTIGIVNKESLVCGWTLVKKKLVKHKTIFIPIDSEHFSIFSLLQNYKSKNLLRIDGTIEPSLLSQINDAMNPDQSTPPVKFLFGFANDDVPKRLAARVQEAIDFLENTPEDAQDKYYETAKIITGIADETLLEDGAVVEKKAGDNGILAKQAFNPGKMSDIKTYKYLLNILEGIDTDAETYVLGIDDPYQEAEFWEELARENGITISEAKSGPYQTMLTSIPESVSEHLGLGDSLP